MSTMLMPNLMTENVNATVRFYCEHLGFHMLMGLPFDTEQSIKEYSEAIPLQFSMLEHEGAMLMVQARASLAGECAMFAEMPIAVSGTYYLEVENLDKLLAGLGKDVEVVLPERITFYGMREVWIRDNNGYVVTLAEKHAPGVA